MLPKSDAKEASREPDTIALPRQYVQLMVLNEGDPDAEPYMYHQARNIGNC